MSMHRASPLGKLRAIVVILCLAIILGVLGYAFLACRANSVLGKDEILARIDELSGDDPDYNYVSSYLTKYGINNINSIKLNSVEKRLEDNFYKALPDEMEIAKSVTMLFLSDYYDAIDLSNKEAVTDAILKCMVESIGDDYAYYRTRAEFEEYLSGLEGGEEFVGIGVQVNRETLEITMVFKDSGAEAAGIKPGDIIWGVENKTAEDTSLDDLINMIRGEPDTPVKVIVKRDGELLEFTATRKVLTERSVYYEMKGEIGYIQLVQFLGDTPAQFKEAVDFLEESGAGALVIDVRYNPGGLLNSVVDIIDYLVPDAEGRRIGSYTELGVEYVFHTRDGHSTDLPIVVICNEYTASAGELFTGAMKDYAKEGVMNALIIGTHESGHTFGKGVAQNSYTLYDLSGLTFTIGYFNPPSNENFNGVGVEYDMTVGEAEDKDAPLEGAIEEALKLSIKQDGTEVSLDAAA